MAEKTICYVRLKSGKYKKCSSKNGENFQLKGKPYNAPNADNYEIMELNHWLMGRRRQSFYVEDQPNALPLSKKGKWRETADIQNDKDMLVDITRQALMEAGQAELKVNASLAGVGLLIVLQFVDWVIFG